MKDYDEDSTFFSKVSESRVRCEPVRLEDYGISLLSCNAEGLSGVSIDVASTLQESI